jgi:methionine aminopeptidase
VASWIKLLVIMHANKIGAKKKTIFLDESSSFDFEPFVSLNSQKVTSSQTIKRYTQDQRLKLIQRTMKKVILILQRVISVFKIQDSQKITLNSVCWVFDRRNLIFKN